MKIAFLDISSGSTRQLLNPSQLEWVKIGQDQTNVKFDGKAVQAVGSDFGRIASREIRNRYNIVRIDHNGLSIDNNGHDKSVLVAESCGVTLIVFRPYIVSVGKTDSSVVINTAASSISFDSQEPTSDAESVAEEFDMILL